MVAEDARFAGYMNSWEPAICTLNSDRQVVNPKHDAGAFRRYGVRFPMGLVPLLTCTTILLTPRLSS